MALIIVRHGQTEANARGLLLGRGDPPLDALGREQAAAVSQAVTPVRVVSSPLQRARQTAAIIVGERDVEVETDERWIELDYGTFEGMPVAEVPEATWVQWRADPTFVPGGGESLLDLGVRVEAACEELIVSARDGDVVVVTHVSPVKAAVAWALGVSQQATWRMYVAPGSVTRVAPRPWGHVLASFNETPWK
jgi:broad specificity phosphatase PhoE